MNYAYPTEYAYETTKKILKKTPLSKEAKERREYIRSHHFAVDVEPTTHKCKLIVTKKGAENE